VHHGNPVLGFVKRSRPGVTRRGKTRRAVTLPALREVIFVSTSAEDIYRRFQIGDTLRLELTGRTISGKLMPSHVFTSPGVVVLKVSSGYNVGVHEEEIREAVLVEASVPGSRDEPPGMTGVQGITPEHQKPRITIITMGGTIASRVEYATGAVKAVLDTDELLGLNPSLAAIATIGCVGVSNILGENMTPRHMAEAAKVIAREINTGAEGVVVTHGTDTMGYTAAMLSFMLPGLPVPVVLTGSQRSSDRPSSDATGNLYDAVLVASSGKPGVMVTMHGSSSDSFSSIHRGTKVRKFHTSTRDAFRSVNCDVLGKVENGTVEWSPSAQEFFALREPATGDKGNYAPQPAWNEKVSLLHVHPGLKTEIMASVLEGSRGIVFAGTGFGHISSEHFARVEEFLTRGGIAVMSSQCLNGTVNMNIYTNGRELLGMGVVPGGDMLPETALMKLMWVMGQTGDRDEVIRLMRENLRGELTERRRLWVEEEC